MRYYRISEFANMVGVSSSTLRNWEDKGILLPHHKTPTGYRYYSDEQLKELMQLMSDNVVARDGFKS